MQRKVNVVEDLDGNKIVVIKDKHMKDAKYGWYSYIDATDDIVDCYLIVVSDHVGNVAKKKLTS